MDNKTIVFVGGGTLGHLAPSVAVIKELKNNYPKLKIYYFTTNKETEKDYIKKNLGKYLSGMQSFDLLGYKRSLFSLESLRYNIKSIKKYLKAKKKIKQDLMKIKPDLIIGMGGYISGFVLKIGFKLKYKAIIHEQNAFLGLSNKIVSKKVDKILLSFPIVNQKEKYQNKTKIVGNPAINEVLIYKNKYFEKENNILVISGSMGSSLINDLAIDTAMELKNYNFTIVSGKKYYKDNQSLIKEINANKNINIIPFSTELKKLMCEASLIVSRCGSSSLFEILGLEKLSILIPSTYVSDNHQVLNSNVLKDKNQAIVIYEKDLNVNRLKEEIELLCSSYYRKKEIVNNIKNDDYINSLNNFIKEVEDILYE